MQHVIKKTKDLPGVFFVVEGSLAENAQKFQFLIIQQTGTVFLIYLYF